MALDTNNDALKGRTPRPLKPAEIRVLACLARKDYERPSHLAVDAGINVEWNTAAITRVMESLKTMGLATRDFQGDEYAIRITQHGRAALTLAAASK